MLGADAEGRAALLTNCGMAAITTVLAFVERSCDGPIVVDANVYHETRHLLLGGSLRARCHVVPSDDVVDHTSRLGASVVFVDAVSNTRDVRVADLAALAALPITLVVDTSVCTMTAALVAPVLRGAASVVLVESLTKHAQLGLDRVPAGVIVADEVNARRIDALREHLGTNITDIACMLLPAPDRVALRQRLDRIARNASLWAAAPTLAPLGVRHPSLSSHPDHDRWRATQPSCGLMTCRADAPIERWLACARAAHLPLDHGAGFAFDVSRVYRTTRTVPEADAFVRIAPGTEPADVTEALIAAVSAP
jgi:cystathionine beta-lyase/cystathionine gamma-synthase